jgi:Ca-activated chloride channel family protein
VGKAGPTDCRLVAFSAWIVAAAGPRLGGSQVEVKKEGIAIVIAIDLSSSMLAEDLSSSRSMAWRRRRSR